MLHFTNPIYGIYKTELDQQITSFDGLKPILLEFTTFPQERERICLFKRGIFRKNSVIVILVIGSIEKF